MLKYSISVFSMIIGALASASASGSEVKVTSFRFLEHGQHFSPTAEICGELVIPSAKPEMIKITSDPDSKGPATYNVWSGKDGKFCSVIATFTGKANAELNQ